MQLASAANYLFTLWTFGFSSLSYIRREMTHTTTLADFGALCHLPSLQLSLQMAYILSLPSYINSDEPARTKFLKPRFTGFFGLYCRILHYFVFEGIFFSSAELSFSGSSFLQFAATFPTIHQTLNNLSPACLSFLMLSTKCRNRHSFSNLFLGIISAIDRQLVIA